MPANTGEVTEASESDSVDVARRGDSEGGTSLVARVAGAMRADIVAGVYDADSRLNIDALAQRFGVSTIPVREALRGLATEGLVTIHANKGFRVSSATLADLEETYRLRTVLDPLAVWLAVPRLDTADLEELRARLEGMRVAEDGDDAAGYWEHHVEFHFRLYRRCDNPWLLRFVSALYANSDRYRPPGLGPPSPRYQEHKAVLEACRAGDGRHAAELMKAHIWQTFVLRMPRFGEDAQIGPDWPGLDWRFPDRSSASPQRPLRR